MNETIRRLKGAGLGALVLALAACASTPREPVEQIGKAESAIETAKDQTAGIAPPSELAQARNKLRLSEEAIQDRRFERADRLAQQAEVDARLAAKRAQLAKAQRAVAEIEASIRLVEGEYQ